MKTLFFKELREHLNLAVIALLLALAVVVGTQIYYINLIKGIANSVSQAENYYYRLQPLTSGNFDGLSTILCILVPFALGWFQVYKERHRDAWAFLIHRPVTRSAIFLGKTIAGLTIYVLAVGLPLLFFVFWVRAPGDVAAPFEWSMASVLLRTFLIGTAWYFAGLLTGLRQARWYGSRVLAIGAAALASFRGDYFLWAPLITVTLAVAAWGAFHNQGQFQGQPVIGKIALTLSLAPGVAIVLLGTIGLVLAFLGMNSDTAWPHYALGHDGVIYKIAPDRNGVVQILSLADKPPMDTNTGQAMDLSTFNTHFNIGGITAAPFHDGFNPYETSRYQFFGADRHTLWFAVTEAGRLRGYDNESRRFIGSLGPEGFSASPEGNGSRFAPSSQWFNAFWTGDPLRTLVTTNTVYQVNLENRAVKSAWTTAAGDNIEAYGTTFRSETTMVVTHQKIIYLRMTSASATPLWSAPFPHEDADFNSVTAYSYQSKGTDESAYSVWIQPPNWGSFPSSDKRPTHVLDLNGRGEITQTEDLPALPPMNNLSIVDKFLISAAPLALEFVPHWRYGSFRHLHLSWPAIRLNLIWSAASLPFAFWLSRRYGFSTSRQTTWLLFVLFLGVPGLLVFIAVQEWPAREACPNCHRPRVVENEACEHCGAAFRPPEKNGTEIFAQLPELSG